LRIVRGPRIILNVEKLGANARMTIKQPHFSGEELYDSAGYVVADRSHLICELVLDPGGALVCRCRRIDNEPFGPPPLPQYRRPRSYADYLLLKYVHSNSEPRAPLGVGEGEGPRELDVEVLSDPIAAASLYRAQQEKPCQLPTLGGVAWGYRNRVYFGKEEAKALAINRTEEAKAAIDELRSILRVGLVNTPQRDLEGSDDIQRGTSSLTAGP
jgi:hypothetical protein